MFGLKLKVLNDTWSAYTSAWSTTEDLPDLPFAVMLNYVPRK